LIFTRRFVRFMLIHIMRPFAPVYISERGVLITV